MTNKAAAREIDLLPCPFCGSKPRIIEIGDEYPEAGGLVISCPECGASSRPVFPDKCTDEEWIAVTGWNTRPEIIAQHDSETVQLLRRWIKAYENTDDDCTVAIICVDSNAHLATLDGK